MFFRLIHPTAGVVAEFATAHQMIAYFVHKGREPVPPEAEMKGLMLQVSQGGLYFQELIDGDAGPMQLPIDGAMIKAATRLMQ
jgi:hypothetical protein